jgi:hypothetical protein
LRDPSRSRNAAFVAESARHEIRKRCDMIRRHCDARGLALPAEVASSSE